MPDAAMLSITVHAALMEQFITADHERKSVERRHVGAEVVLPELTLFVNLALVKTTYVNVYMDRMAFVAVPPEKLPDSLLAFIEEEYGSAKMWLCFVLFQQADCSWRCVTKVTFAPEVQASGACSAREAAELFIRTMSNC